jgi:lipopolysaccharide export system protein LptA
VAWQKALRIVVALVGIAVSLAVYFTMRERQVAPPPQPVERVDPAATIEISGSVLKSFTETFKDFEVNKARYSQYSDGSFKLTPDGADRLQIVIYRGETRTFRIAAREARVSPDRNHFELTGPLRMDDSDGFWLETDTATVNRLDSIVQIPGAATFGKGRMSGSGTALTYDEARQVLAISKQTQVRTVDESGKTVMQLSSEAAMLDRMQHLLTADAGVSVMRNDQVIAADHATSRLGPNNDVVTFIELHGNSQVTGGPPIEAMSARDISLDYTDDGKTLEAVKMAGSAAAAMVGQGGSSGRRIAAETLDLGFAADGKLTAAIGRGNVRMTLPAGADTPPRTITAQALDGTGEAGKGLTSVRFTTDVTYVEEPLPAKGAAADKPSGTRSAKAPKLELSMSDDAVNAAIFSAPPGGGQVTFEETGLKACAPRAEYRPEKGSLLLSGATKAVKPMVAEEQTAIEGQTINVGLDTRRMTASGGTTTWMRAKGVTRCRPSAQRSAKEQGANNVPRLLKADAPATITAPELEYESERGYAVFSGGPDRGRSTLDQDDTTITGDRIVIDQTKGDLTVTGRASAQLLLDGKRTNTQAHEIRYVDEKRSIAFDSDAKAGTKEVLLRSGPESDLRAGSIDATLAAKDNMMERMKARSNVSIVEGAHIVTGGTTLDYTASTGEYVVRSNGSAPVVAITRNGSECRRNNGGLIRFYKGKSKTVEVEGGGFRNASLDQSKAACTPTR